MARNAPDPVAELRSSLRQHVATATAVLLMLIGGSKAQENERRSENRADTVRDDSWDALFTRSSGWTGGDVASTIDLDDARTLWVFGDSWIGRVEEGRHVPGSRIVRNAIAVARSCRGHLNRPPQPSEIQFHWGPPDDEGLPTSWITPDSARVGSDAQSANPDQPHGWFWPTGGGAILPGRDGQPRLAIFLFHVGQRQLRGGTANFKILGGALAVVKNPTDDADHWQVTQFDVPHAVDGAAAVNDDSLHPTNWGMTVCRKREPTGVDDRFAYIYGVRTQSAWNRQLVLARAPAHAIEQMDRWEFYAGGNSWSAKSHGAAAIADNLVSELSVERRTVDGGVTYVMVHSEAIFGRRIFVRTAPQPEGPWSRPTAVYAVDELDRNKKYFTYAAKGHLRMSRPGELLITYIVNSHDFGAMVRDASIYRPRFIRVPLEKVFKAN